MNRILEESQIPALLSNFGFYDELPCGVIAFNPEGKVYCANKTLSRWVGRELSDISAKGFKSMISKPSLLYYNLILEPMLNLNQEVSEINIQLTGKEGNIDVLLNGIIFRNSENKVVMVQATLQRITNRKKYEVELLMERRRAEEQQRKLEFVLNLVPIQIWTADRLGNILSINQKVVEYFGDLNLQDAGEFSGVFLPDREKALAQWKKAVKSGRHYEREMRLLGSSGQPEWFLVKGEPFFNPEGEIDSWFCCSINIHKQRLLQMANQQDLTQHLSSAYESLDKSEKQLSSIAIDQSHMVRKPVANIIGIMGLIKEESDDMVRNDMLEMLSDSVNELDEMIKRITNGIR